MSFPEYRTVLPQPERFNETATRKAKREAVIDSPADETLPLQAT